MQSVWFYNFLAPFLVHRVAENVAKNVLFAIPTGSIFSHEIIIIRDGSKKSVAFTPDSEYLRCARLRNAILQITRKHIFRTELYNLSLFFNKKVDEFK